MGKKKEAKRRLRAAMAANGGANAMGNPPLGGLRGLLGNQPGEQFLAGALLGALGAYLLSDEQLRGKLIRAGLALYGDLAAGFEEIKEQTGDIRAELEAAQNR